jgi:acetolactate synthase-1/2/3 large subunit
MMDREAFQEIDYRQMFGPVAKWAAQIDVTARIPEYIARAFHTATSGRPGPVVLALPEDMLTEVTQAGDAVRYQPTQPAPAQAAFASIRELLEGAKKPMILVGGPGWSDRACAQLKTFAETNGIPVATSFRRQDLFDNRSACFAGDLGTSGPPALVQRFKDADLLLVIGARLGEMTTQGYTILHAPTVRPKLIHVHADANELGKVFTPDIAVQSSANNFATGLADANWFAADRWKAWRDSARTDYLSAVAAPDCTQALDLGAAMIGLGKRLGDNAIVTLDAGNHTGWPQRYLTYARPGRQIGPTNGAMGYSVPAAVAASLVHPDRIVIGCVGDGGFMMSGQEISTAVQHGGKPIILLFNNNMYGTIRMHQEREHPSRVVGTDLVNPDFVSMAKAMGAHAERVENTADFAPAFERAVAAGRAALIELCTDPEQISTRTTITNLRVAAEKRQAQTAGD